jgi:hypothetical protein
MTDRWNPKWVSRPVARELKVFVPDGAPPASSTVEPRGKTWGIRRRGDVDGQVKHAYRCPVHGVFELEVSRSDVPDAVPCPMYDVVHVDSAILVDGTCESTWRVTGNACTNAAPWAGSSCGIGHAAGEVMS